MNTTNISKISAYIGFAAKARKIIWGVDNITKRIKTRRLIVLCDTASENTKKQITEYAEKTKSPCILLTDTTIEDILKKQNCKVIALTDTNLAKAIIENFNA